MVFSSYCKTYKCTLAYSWLYIFLENLEWSKELKFLNLTLPQIMWQSPSFQLTPYLSKTYLDMCNQLYSVSLINFGPTTQSYQPWLGGSKLHSKLWLLTCNISWKYEIFDLVDFKLLHRLGIRFYRYIINYFILLRSPCIFKNFKKSFLSLVL